MKTHYLILILLLFASCDDLGKQEEFSLVKKDLDGSWLKTDGYFFAKHKSTGDSGDLYVVYVFYRNGIAIDLSAMFDLNEIEEEFRNGNCYQYIKNNPNVWGLFNIDSISIKIEHPYPVGWINTPVYTSFGKILNDTTFILTKKKHLYGSEEIALQDTFHFKQLLPKPDSINKFIK